MKRDLMKALCMVFLLPLLLRSFSFSVEEPTTTQQRLAQFLSGAKARLRKAPTTTREADSLMKVFHGI